MVAGFAQSSPNAVLMQFAAAELRRAGQGRVVDLGCGAGRNAVPLARLGWEVLGVDLSWPMLGAALERARTEGIAERLQLALSPMHRLPAPDGSFDLVIAHGIWNLAQTVAEFRAAVREGARVARPGARLFLFTFSRHTLAPEAVPVPGEPFVFTQFSGRPHCFLTEEQLVAELGAAGFVRDDGVPFRELNRPVPGALQPAGGPVIYEGLFRYEG